MLQNYIVINIAVAVIGGLITSTFLNLLVIPAVFTFVDDSGQFFSRLFKKNEPHDKILAQAKSP